MMRRSIHLAVVTLAIVASAAACASSSKRGDAEQAFVDSAVAAMVKDKAQPFSEKESRCFVSRIIHLVGVPRLVGAGLTASDLKSAANPLARIRFTAAERAELADVMFDGKCFDFGRVIGRSPEGAAALGAVPKDKVVCFFDHAARNASFRAAYVARLVGAPASSDPLGSAQATLMADCGIDPSKLGG